MKPRHTQIHDRHTIRHGGKGNLLGYVEEFDVYIQEHTPEYDGDSAPMLTLVGPPIVYPRTNYDCFAVMNGGIRPMPSVDLNITPYHMCLLYALCIEHGLIKEQEDGA
jgi:hypothetical protein